jgi:hypothetical protein
LKRKITYGILTVLLLAGIYLGLRFAFGFFTPFNCWTAQQDIKNGKIKIAEVGEMPLNFEQKQKLANAYGFDFYLFGCNVTKDVINGTKYYNEVMIDHLEEKHGKGWWTTFQSKLDSIDDAADDLQNPVARRLSFRNIEEVTADTSVGVWVKKQDSSFSLALHFQDKDTLSVSYSPECWLMFPYQLDGNKIVVYWDNNIDTKYDFDLVRAVSKTDKQYIGKPFMVLALENDTTLSATYPLQELVRKINRASKVRTFFPDRFQVVQEGEMYD